MSIKSQHLMQPAIAATHLEHGTFGSVAVDAAGKDGVAVPLERIA